MLTTTREERCRPVALRKTLVVPKAALPPDFRHATADPAEPEGSEPRPRHWAIRAIPTMSIIVKIWTTCPHVSNVAPYAETGTTDNVPYAELPQTGQKRFTAPR